jgi:polysaccharide export outer membrane protein
MKHFSRFLFFLTLVFILPACRILVPNQMFKQKDYQYFELAHKKMEQYTIQCGDELTLQVYSRDGFKLIDVIGNNGTTNSMGENSSGAIYIVDNEGFAKIPILGQFYIKGYTEAELEKVLAERLANLFVDPYVVARVNNRRAIVFLGSGAQIVKLNRSPSSLIEVLAQVGGIDATGKAYRIKIIRGDLKNPEIHLIDLSTLEGIRKADLTIQNNDIVYIEKVYNYPRELLKDISPVLGLITSLSTFIFLILRFGK